MEMIARQDQRSAAVCAEDGHGVKLALLASDDYSVALGPGHVRAVFVEIGFYADVERSLCGGLRRLGASVLKEAGNCEHSQSGEGRGGYEIASIHFRSVFLRHEQAPLSLPPLIYRSLR